MFTYFQYRCILTMPYVHHLNMMVELVKPMGDGLVDKFAKKTCTFRNYKN
jgi:hypothetical protein